MKRAITSVAIQYEHDVVLARQRARQIAALLGFDTHDQVRIATAVSEIARNAFRYAGKGKAEFSVSKAAPPALKIQISDQGKGIPNLQQVLDGQYVSQTGMGMGILGARRLMDEFEIQTEVGKGTTVVLAKTLPRKSADIDIGALAEQLARQAPQDPFEELQRQNQELMATLAEVQRQRTELSHLNRELEDTNRGVVALYAELDERADYLRRASELKSQFLSNMTHEFRTPLNSVLSLVRILLDRIDGPLTSEQERQVKFIQKATQDLYELVNDLLDLAKVEAGKLTIRPAEFSIRDLFGALRGMLRPLLAHNSAVTLLFEDPVDLPMLRTDESKVSQILRNLISNALKFTERGNVRVTAAMDGPDTVAITVSDTGIGIARWDHERIFQEFTQIEGRHQKGKPGTGLGLPLSRKLAQLLGGSLEVESQPDIGSAFTLRIPIEFKGATEVTYAEAIEIDPKRNPVLIIEDNPEALLAYEKFLQGTAFQAIPARSIQEAKRALERFIPKAIILDILLGRENAWDLLHELKQSEATRGIPVLVITQVENEQKARALGAEAFHSKPVERSWLLDHLRNFLHGAPKAPILIIDDDPAWRYILSSFLADTGFRIIEAADGKTGLALAAAEMPALIFLDLLMPDMDGFEVIEKMKADPETAAIPIAIHTSKTLTEEDRERIRGRVVASIKKHHQDRPASAKQIQKVLALARDARA